MFADQLKNEENDFWAWLSEKLATHPHLSKRITNEMLSPVVSQRKKYSLKGDANTPSKEMSIPQEEDTINKESEDYSKYMPKS